MTKGTQQNNVTVYNKYKYYCPSHDKQNCEFASTTLNETVEAVSLMF